MNITIKVPSGEIIATHVFDYSQLKLLSVDQDGHGNITIVIEPEES